MRWGDWKRVDSWRRAPRRVYFPPLFLQESPSLCHVSPVCSPQVISQELFEMDFSRTRCKEKNVIYPCATGAGRMLKPQSKWAACCTIYVWVQTRLSSNVQREFDRHLVKSGFHHLDWRWNVPSSAVVMMRLLKVSLNLGYNNSPLSENIAHN